MFSDNPFKVQQGFSAGWKPGSGGLIRGEQRLRPCLETQRKPSAASCLPFLWFHGQGLVSTQGVARVHHTHQVAKGLHPVLCHCWAWMPGRWRSLRSCQRTRPSQCTAAGLWWISAAAPTSPTPATSRPLHASRYQRPLAVQHSLPPGTRIWPHGWQLLLAHGTQPASRIAARHVVGDNGMRCRVLVPGGLWGWDGIA